MKIGIGDLPILFEVLQENTYEEIVSCVLPDSTIFDFGANIGMVSMFLKSHCDNTIIAVEPSKRNYNLLVNNVRGLNNNICLNVAISDKKDSVRMSIDENPYNQKIVEAGRFELVEGVLINEILAKYKSSHNVVKMDIEGYEEVIFENDTDWLRMIDVLIVEFHSFNGKQRIRKEMIDKHFSEVVINNTVFLFKR